MHLVVMSIGLSCFISDFCCSLEILVNIYYFICFLFKIMASIYQLSFCLLLVHYTLSKKTPALTQGTHLRNNSMPVNIAIPSCMYGLVSEWRGHSGQHLICQSGFSTPYHVFTVAPHALVFVHLLWGLDGGCLNWICAFLMFLLG